MYDVGLPRGCPRTVERVEARLMPSSPAHLLIHFSSELKGEKPCSGDFGSIQEESVEKSIAVGRAAGHGGRRPGGFSARSARPKFVRR